MSINERHRRNLDATLRGMNRRKFMTMAAIAAASLPRSGWAEHHVVSADPLKADCDLASPAARYTSVEDFYIRNHGDLPKDFGNGLLRIEGEVEQPQQLTMGDLARLRKRELGAVLECAGNFPATVGKVSNGVWQGWALRDVIALARPTTLTGAYLNLFGRDGYARSIPFDQEHSEAMLVTHLDGRPLFRYHGAPWRALFPGWYGMESVKWVERIAISKTPLPANDLAYMKVFEETCGETTTQPLPRVQIKSVILSPPNRAILHAGKIEMRGLAWCGEADVAGVDVSGDGGRSWSAASVQVISRYEWASWRAELELTERGVVDLVCRAQDGKGTVQPAERDPKRFDGYVDNWYHHVRCVVM